MKKYIILLLSSLFITSCSSENSPTNETPEGSIFRSYKYEGGSEHFFENKGTRYEKITVGDNLLLKYIYDENNKMTQIIKGPNDSHPLTTTFTYNDKGQIIKMEKDVIKDHSIKTLTWLYTYNDNTITGELVSDANPILYHTTILYTFNTKGLLLTRHEYKKYVDIKKPIVTVSKITLKYDDQNKNIISRKATTNRSNLPDDLAIMTSFITNFEYDDKINPIHQIYMNHYINYILNNDFPFYSDGNFIQGGDVETGTNNLTRTIYSSDESPPGSTFPENIYINQYTYQLNNLPKRRARISTDDNKEYWSTTYNYIAK